MKSFRYFSIPFLFLISAHFLAAHKTTYILHANGYGPVEIGFTLNEASKALKTKILPLNPRDDEESSCHYVSPLYQERTIGFMIQNKVITRIDVYTNAIFTDTGITVGMSADKIFEVYGKRVIEKIHPYLGKRGQYLIIDILPERRLIFETENGKIRSFRIGFANPVNYIEGCL